MDVDDTTVTLVSAALLIDLQRDGRFFLGSKESRTEDFAVTQKSLFSSHHILPLPYCPGFQGWKDFLGSFESCQNVGTRQEYDGR